MFFLKPNIPKLKHRKDEKALIKALSHKDDAIRRHTAVALLEIGSDNGLCAIERCFSQCCPPAIDETWFLAELSKQHKEYKTVSMQFYLKTLLTLQTDESIACFERYLLEHSLGRREKIAYAIEEIGLDMLPDIRLWHILMASKTIEEIKTPKLFKSNPSVLVKCLNSTDKTLCSLSLAVLSKIADPSHHQLCDPVLAYIKEDPETLSRGIDAALEIMVRIDCRQTYADLGAVFGTLSRRCDTRSHFEDALRRLIEKESFEDLFDRLNKENNLELMAFLLDAMARECTVEQAQKLLPLVRQWIAYYNTHYNDYGYDDRVEAFLMSALTILIKFKTARIISVIIDIPDIRYEYSHMKEIFFSSLNINGDNPERKELVTLLCDAVKKNKTYIYPALIKTEGITPNIIELLAEEGPERLAGADEPNRVTTFGEDIRDILQKREDRQTLNRMFSEFFDRTQSTAKRIILARRLYSNDMDPQSALLIWSILASKDWDLLDKAGEKAVPVLQEAIEYTLAGNDYFLSDIKQILTLYDAYHPQKTAALLERVADDNPLKPYLLAFLVSKNPPLLKRHTGFISDVTIRETNRIAEKLNQFKSYVGDEAAGDFFLCKSIIKDLSHIVDLNGGTMPEPLIELLESNSWLLTFESPQSRENLYLLMSRVDKRLWDIVSQELPGVT